MYFSSLFPYLVLICFLVRALLLEGSMVGIRHMFTPKVSVQPRVPREMNHPMIARANAAVRRSHTTVGVVSFVSSPTAEENRHHGFYFGNFEDKKPSELSVSPFLG